MLLQEQELPQNQRPPTKKANGNTEEPQGKPDMDPYVPIPYKVPYGSHLLNRVPNWAPINYLGPWDP